MQSTGELRYEFGRLLSVGAGSLQRIATRYPHPPMPVSYSEQLTNSSRQVFEFKDLKYKSIFNTGVESVAVKKSNELRSTKRGLELTTQKAGASSSSKATKLVGVNVALVGSLYFLRNEEVGVNTRVSGY
jgi:hypothetical protein